MERSDTRCSTRKGDSTGRRKHGMDGEKYDIVDSFCYVGDMLSRKRGAVAAVRGHPELSSFS